MSSPLVGRRQHHRSGDAVTVGPQPVDGRDAPSVTGNEAGEVVLRHRRHQVVADAALVGEELGRHHGADRVAAEVVGPGVAAAVPVEAGEGVGPAGFELAAEHVAIGHARQYRIDGCAKHWPSAEPEPDRRVSEGRSARVRCEQ